MYVWVCRLQMDKTALQSACNLEVEARAADKAAHLDQKAVMLTEMEALKAREWLHAS
jgi:hypothetical protein